MWVNPIGRLGVAHHGRLANEHIGDVEGHALRVAITVVTQAP